MIAVLRSFTSDRMSAVLAVVVRLQVIFTRALSLSSLRLSLVLAAADSSRVDSESGLREQRREKRGREAADQTLPRFPFAGCARRASLVARSRPLLGLPARLQALAVARRLQIAFRERNAIPVLVSQ